MIIDLTLVLSIALPCVSGGSVWGVMQYRLNNLNDKVNKLEADQKDSAKEQQKDFKELNQKLDLILKEFFGLRSVLKYKEQIEIESKL